jgi:hypothetical protein
MDDMGEITYGNAVWVLLANSLGLCLAFLWRPRGEPTIRQIEDISAVKTRGTTPLTEGVLVLEFGAHYDLSGG